MIKKCYPTLLAAALSAIVATNSSAVLITNVTTNTVLFSDDFEGVAASPVGFADDDGTIFDPVADIGTWTTIAEVGNNEIQVSNFSGTTSGDDGVFYPGAIEGNNYLRINRPPGGAFNFALGTLSAPQTTVGDVIRAEFSLYGRTGGPDVIAFYENDPGTGGLAERIRLNINASGDIVRAREGADPDLDTGLDWIADQWQTWQIEFVIGESTFDLTVDGVTVTGLTTEDNGTTNFDAFRTIRLGSSPDVEYLIDAVDLGDQLPVIESVVRFPDGTLAVEVVGIPGQTYQIQLSSDLNNWFGSEVQENVSGSVEFAVEFDVSDESGFLRILVLD